MWDPRRARGGPNAFGRFRVTVFAAVVSLYAQYAWDIEKKSVRIMVAQRVPMALGP